MKKTKAIFSAFLALTMAVSIAGCSSGSKSTTSSGKVDNSKFVTINMYNFGDQTNDNWETVQTAMNTYLKDKTNLNCAISLHYMTWTNWQSSYATLLASGQPLDLVNSASDWLNMWDNAAKGAFTDLTTLLPVYAPELYKDISKADWKKCTYNGKIICIPENRYTQWVNHGYMYRGDWAKQAGLSHISTWDQMTTYFKWVKANKSGVTPWDASASNYAYGDGWITSTTQNVPMNIGIDPYLWATKSKSDYTIITPWTDEANLDKFAAQAKDWNTIGVWKTDVLNNTDNSETMLQSGLNGTHQHHVQTFATEKKTMETKQPGSDLQMFGWWEPSGNLEKMTITHGSTCIGSGSKNPGRALELMNLIETNKDFYMLLNYGILNQTYFINDKGENYTPAGFDSNKSGYMADFWGGRLDSFEPKLATRYDGYDDYSKSLEKIAYDDPIDGFAYDSTNYANQIAAINQVFTSEMPGIAFGKSSDQNAAVKKFIADLKAAGLDTVQADMQKQLNKWRSSIK